MYRLFCFQDEIEEPDPGFQVDCLKPAINAVLFIRGVPKYTMGYFQLEKK